MGREKNAENIPFLRSTQPKSTERVPVVELSGDEWAKCLKVFTAKHPTVMMALISAKARIAKVEKQLP